MPSFRKLDAFVKPRHDLRSRSALGGLVTLLAASTATVLFFAELYLYFQGMTYHSLHLSESKSLPLLPPYESSSSSSSFSSRSSSTMSDAEHWKHYQRSLAKIPLDILVTFPYLSCRQLDFSLNGGSHSVGTLEQMHGDKQFLRKRTPTSSEMLAATGGESRHTNAVGCTIMGNLRIPIVAGEFAIQVNRQAWSAVTARLLLGMLDTSPLGIGSSSSNNDALNINMNMTHYVHYVRFGKPYSYGGTTNPLENRLQTIENKYGGVALQQVQVRIIPTIYQGFLSEKNTYQLSVVDHTVDPETLVSEGVLLLPGLVVNYDFSPLAVHHVEMRDNIFVFLGSLVSIVGGVFVTVGLVVGCFVHSASVVAKKLD